MNAVQSPDEGAAISGRAASALRINQDHIQLQLHAYRGRLHARISAQIYNDRAEIQQLATAVLPRRGRE